LANHQQYNVTKLFENGKENWEFLVVARVWEGGGQERLCFNLVSVFFNPAKNSVRPSDGGAGCLIGGFAQKMFELRSKNSAKLFI